MIDILLRVYDEVYFWPQSIDDLRYLHELSNIENVNIISPNLDAYDNILSGNIDYVGNRLHGGIYALQHYCRTIIISIDYRAEEMAKNYSFKCLARKEISNNLEDIILKEWETAISGLDFQKINEWKRQFI